MTHKTDKTFLSTLSVHQYMPCFAFLLTIPWQMINHIRTIFADKFPRHFLKTIKLISVCLYLSKSFAELNSCVQILSVCGSQTNFKEQLLIVKIGWLTIAVKFSWSIGIFSSDFICEIKRIAFIFRIDC